MDQYTIHHPVEGLNAYRQHCSPRITLRTRMTTAMEKRMMNLPRSMFGTSRLRRLRSNLVWGGDGQVLHNERRWGLAVKHQRQSLFVRIVVQNRFNGVANVRHVILGIHFRSSPSRETQRVTFLVVVVAAWEDRHITCCQGIHHRGDHNLLLDQVGLVGLFLEVAMVLLTVNMKVRTNPSLGWMVYIHRMTIDQSRSQKSIWIRRTNRGGLKSPTMVKSMQF
mmetsp:Transcript_27151/g.64964  ORF Transcript_27151/g.64964 Transcript_27151/m.64964 type:complete len:222 (+) Transcript_27151:158-823(+)